jgi:glycerol-3-phosphate dehydrogenase
MLSAAETLAAEPSLKRQGLQGAACYYDAQIESPERMAVENITDARDHGAACFNYAAVTGAIQLGDRITGVQVEDTLTGEHREVRGRVVVNASGPWFDRVASRLNHVATPKIRTTKGVHLACPHPTNRAVVLNSPIDGRLFFVIPLRGFAWIGTTDTDFTDDPSTACATQADVDYLKSSVEAFIPQLTGTPVYWTNAGVRALVMQPGSESSVSRTHRIDSSTGLVSVLGGKITGYRAIAQDAVDAVDEQLGAKRECVTGKNKLPGTRSPHEEQCVHLADYMMRRTSLSFTPDQGRGLVEDTARRLAAELGWSPEQTQAEVHSYLAGLVHCES